MKVGKAKIVAKTLCLPIFDLDRTGRLSESYSRNLAHLKKLPLPPNRRSLRLQRYGAQNFLLVATFVDQSPGTPTVAADEREFIGSVFAAQRSHQPLNFLIRTVDNDTAGAFFRQQFVHNFVVFVVLSYVRIFGPLLKASAWVKNNPFFTVMKGITVMNRVQLISYVSSILVLNHVQTFRLENLSHSNLEVEFHAIN
uniref:Uncharacterized protein n=1 Tax=Romanomermis culicivorax TaxID=13658 RepID=A0A915KLZ3_ROMCU